MQIALQVNMEIHKIKNVIPVIQTVQLVMEELIKIVGVAKDLCFIIINNAVQHVQMENFQM